MDEPFPSPNTRGQLKGKILHMIGNAHIDPVWLWQWHEGMQEIKATFRSALDRLQEYEDFIFIASSSAFYAWIEENEPAMFAEIQTRVAEGRWELVGGWWVEPDCNIPGGEALVRQGLYGQRYFLSRFGKRARVGYNPDSFGHNASLPQILKRSGLDYYIFMRPGPHEDDTLSPVFWWEADDGSRVLTYRIPYSYTTWGDQLESHIRRCTDDMAAGMDHAMCFYGVGNHGGGPTRQNIDRIHALKNMPDLPQLAMSATETYFDSIATNAATFPIVHNELQHHARGCYAAHSGVKRWNRQGENALLAAEKWAALATWITGLPYPKEDLEKAWKILLFNQFHDILAGTSIESAYNDAQHTYGSVFTTADRVRNSALQKLSWHIATPTTKEGIPLIVFNPHAWSSTVPAELELGWFDHTSYTLVDASGEPVATQEIHPHTSLIGSTRLCFIADLPPLGYHTYRLIPGDRSALHHQVIHTKNTASEWENRWFRITFDADSGSLTGLYDKENGGHVFSGPAARAVIIDDPSDTWSHGVSRYDREMANFSGESITLFEQGAVQTTIRISSTYGASRLTQDFTLYNAIPRIDVHVTVDWHEQFKVLKLCFPLNVTDALATYEIPYGHTVRPLSGDEEPGQSWVDVSGTHPELQKPYGLSLLNDGKYSFSIAGTEVRLTVLRSPIYAHHTPYEPDPDGIYTFIDQGIQRFTYALLPHAGTWKDAQTVRHAAEINQPAFILKETYHPWAHLPQSEALLSATPENIVISAVKLAEDNDDLIVRCFETQNSPTKAILTIFGRSDPITLDLSPCEIKTLRIPADRFSPVTEENLLEYGE